MEHAAEVGQQLDRILADPAFSGASRRSRLLRYLVEQSLEDRPEALKESVIAVEVFERAVDYDPQIDSVVRVEVGRLRTRLAEYYAKAGPDEPVRIEIPKGGYRPVFQFREAVSELAPEASEAPATPAPARRWLTWKALTGLAIVILLAGWAVWRARTSAPTAPASIAVLPFLNLSGNAADEYLGDGITDELTESLAEFNDLRVVARTSAFRYKGKNVDVREIGQSLRAGAVIEGSVARRNGQQLHVVVQLVRTSDGYHLWSHIYDATLAELPALESGIARAVREKLTPSAAPKDFATTHNPEAHDLYMRAAYELNQRSESSVRQAIDLAGQALQKDPAFAQPYVVMAAGESQLNTLLAQPPHQGAVRALADIEKALALDPANNGAHAQKALLTYTDQWDWPSAEREFQLALSAGSHGSAESLYGWCLMTRGRFAESRQHLQQAAELDPLSLGPQLNLVAELVNERNYPEASQKADAILRTAPTNAVALYFATSIAFWQHDCPGATAYSARLLAANPETIIAASGEAVADTACGRSDRAKDAIPRLLRKHPSAYISPYGVAASYAVANDVESAMSSLQKSAELREPTLMSLKVDRAFDTIRQDARFIALERRLGLLE